MTRQFELSRRDAMRLAAALSLSAVVPVRPAMAQTAPTEPGRIDWNRIAPGSEVVIKNGRYGDMFIAIARGTADAPVVIRPETPGGVVFTNSIVMHGSSFAVLKDMRIENSENSAIIIQEGSHDISVEGCEMIDCGLGIWIGNKGADGHRLVGNRVIRSKTMGIAIDAINARPGHETLIERNYIEDSGYHGMEIHGSYYVVLRNEVHGSGKGLSGCSGIHTFCRKANDPHGKNNVIAYNVSVGTVDPSGNDGNGIQADQWCNDNLIAFNLCKDCDGAGINIYDASRTTAMNNTLIGNMRDSGGSHAYRAEISLASDYTTRMERPSGNRVLNNVVVVTNPRAVAIYVEKTTASVQQEIGNNLVFHAGGGELFYWGGTNWRGNAMGRWSELKQGPADISGDPGLGAVQTTGVAMQTLGALRALDVRAVQTGPLVAAGLITPAQANSLVVGAAQPNG